MTKTYDNTARAGYLRLSNAPIIKTREISSQVFCDIDALWFPVGIEFLNISSEQFHTMTEQLNLIKK